MYWHGHGELMVSGEIVPVDVWMLVSDVPVLQITALLVGCKDTTPCGKPKKLGR